MNSEQLSLFPRGLVAFDLETTGLSPLFDRIIEIGAIKWLPGGETTNFQEFVQPGVPIPPENTLIHGITDTDVASAPPLEEVLPRFLRFIGDLPLVAHNARFDSGFLVFSLRQQHIPLPENAVFCSLSLSKSVFQDVSNNRLDTLARLLSIPLKKHHRAWDDSSTCLQLVLTALERSGEQAPEVWKSSRLYSLNEFKKMAPIPSHLSGFEKYISTKRSLEIRYSGGSTPGAWRPVTLQSLLPLPSGNVLYALCHRSEQYKFFFLNKIQDIRSTTNGENSPPALDKI